jgi:DNA-binding XRE family transcriptional regulator
MHSQMKRLYEAQSALAKALDSSPQTIHNWELRGIPATRLVATASQNQPASAGFFSSE